MWLFCCGLLFPCCCWIRDWILEGLVFEGMLVSMRFELLLVREMFDWSVVWLSCELLVLFWLLFDPSVSNAEQFIPFFK